MVSREGGKREVVLSCFAWFTWCSSIQSQWLWVSDPSKRELSWLASTSLNKAFIDVTTSVCNGITQCHFFFEFHFIKVVSQQYNLIFWLWESTFSSNWPGFRGTSPAEVCSLCPRAAQHCLLPGQTAPAIVYSPMNTRVSQKNTPKQQIALFLYILPEVSLKPCRAAAEESPSLHRKWGSVLLV